MKVKELVVPGSPLGTAEEFVAGDNAYEHVDGSVRATSIGFKDLDEGNHEARVQRLTREVKPLERGSVVKCVASLIKEKMVMVEMLEASKDGEPRQILNSFATIPVFNASMRFVERLNDLFRVGDIIEAKVAEVTPYGIDLSTKEPEFGVIRGYCVKCRGPLQLFDQQLKCVACGNPETRKISTHYLLT
ncbi:MAG TPA: exosome complex RNA-binding protein Csl4 [Candidatus Diapherotrites archaeon]|uniref:Exosome complex component Csl4 n=1 Tax=Candidatus Iainarchaeum sp. TaxID=3101447 RepID=A0A7J4JFQ0_9ARCH|nr:exosome complex RNA-binding protein Csl4 [Candidatus Diapherotrites archaeon]HIH16538.1 exosome complex RNA-binding protein Csl4 [Candidatus Diapherotrites archaeon]